MTAILTFFVLHWYLAGFCQSFFLHRYSSHKMFRMPLFWERVFYVLTFLSQGSSYLNPRAYALMHRLHHAYSDTEQDPHSPKYFRSPPAMMWNTLLVYLDIFSGKKEVEAKFQGGYPVWPAFDRWADRNEFRLLWMAGYTFFYVHFAPHWTFYFLLPVHYFLGPIHGAIVNWCGHRYGYQNFENGDWSKNSLPVDLLTVGELMQNNHHHFGSRPNFAVRRFEFDPTYFLIRVLNKLRVVQLNAGVLHG